MSINVLAESAKTCSMQNLIDEEKIMNRFNDTINSLDTISEEVIHSDASVIPVVNINENADDIYAVSLESLIEVANAYDISISESVDIIKETNNIDSHVCCVLPENINEQITVQEFCDFVNYLNENGIYAGWSSELSSDEFITEAGKISALIDKLKDKIKNMNIDATNKNIADIEKKNKILEEELTKVKKMSKEEGDKYAKKQSTKNIAVMGAYTVGSGVAGYVAGNIGGSVIVFKPLLGTILTSFLFTGVLKGVNKVGSKLQDKKLNIIGFDKKTYTTCIKNTIEYNNAAIKQLKNSLEAKK